MNVFNSLSELVGKTPLLKLNNVIDADSKANVFAKLEYFNPAGSVKDRVALKMIEDAEKNGEIKSGATLIEATSGNTGIGICALAAAKGYRAIIVMPETMSEERKKLMTAYGAELVLTEGKKGMQGAIDKANELYKEIDGAFLTKQFENESNSRAHFESTGPEIYADLDGKVDIFVAGVGTGGTLTGVGRYLKSKNPDIKVVAVEPCDSPVLSEGRAGAHCLIEDGRMPALNKITAHQAHNGRFFGVCTTDHGHLLGMTQVQGIVFTEDTDKFHKNFPSVKEKTC